MSSRHLVVAAVATARSFQLRRLVRRTRRKFGKEVAGRSELKFHRSSDCLRVFALHELAKADVTVVWTGMDKQRLPPSHRPEGEDLLTQLFVAAAGEVSRLTRCRSIEFVVDRRIGKEKSRAAFDMAVKAAVLYRHAGYLPPRVQVRHMDSFNSYGLQVADLVSGAVFRALEARDDSFMRLIEHKIGHASLM